MDDKPKDSGKLKLRNTDTNRFKVDTGRLRVQPTPEAASEISKHGAGQTQKNSDYVDPISLRDTSTSKLKRLDGPGAEGTSITPASAASEKKTETVRLKVVRATPRPGTPPPSAAPLANVPLSTPAETEKPAPAAEAPQTAADPEAAPKLSIPQIKLPPRPESPVSVKPGATTNIAAQYPEEPIVGDEVSPAEVKAPLGTAIAEKAPEQAPPATPTPATPESSPGIPTDTASLPTVPPPKPVAEPVSSSTIKLSIKKPGGAPMPAPGSSQTPSPELPPQPATPPPPELPSAEKNGLKIRPSATSGSTVAAPPPATDSGQTAQVAPPPAAGATVKVSPAAMIPPSSGAKISLKKETAEPESAAAAEPAIPSSSTVAIKPPAPGSAGKGLKLSGSASKTVSVPAPGAAAKAPERTPAESGAAEKAAAESVISQGGSPSAGLSMLENVSALVATAALAVTLFSLVMSLLKQL